MVPSTETYATNLESSATCRCSHLPQPRICGNCRLGNSTGRGLVGLAGSFATLSATTMDANLDSRTRPLPSVNCFEDEAVRRAEYVQAVQGVRPVPGEGPATRRISLVGRRSITPFACWRLTLATQIHGLLLELLGIY